MVRAACELGGLGVELVEPVAHGGEAVPQLADAAVELGYAAPEALRAALHVGRAAQELGGAADEGRRAVIELRRRADELADLALYVLRVHVHAEVQVYAVYAHRGHREVLDLGAYDRVYALAGQEREGELLIRAHVRHGGVRGGDARAALAGHGEARLEGVVLVEGARAARVLFDGEAYLERAGFPAELLRGDGLPVELVCERDVPGEAGVLERALIIDFGGVGAQAHLIAVERYLVGGVQHAHLGVVPIVAYIAAGEAVDGVGALDLSRGVEVEVYDLLLLGGLRLRRPGGRGRLGRREGGDEGAQGEEQGEDGRSEAFTHGFLPPWMRRGSPRRAWCGGLRRRTGT